MGVRSPGQEDPLEEEMTIHSSILAWEIPWTKEPRWATVGKEFNMTEATQHARNPTYPVYHFNM